MARILLLHPGEMGSSIGAALVAGGHDVAWVAAGRSDATRKRADEAGLRPVDDLAQGLDGAAFVFSICPPEFALDIARAVDQCNFDGVYVDGNAVSPTTAQSIADIVRGNFVDGGIIGPPARSPGAMRFYMSGERAKEAADLFEGSLVDARGIDGGAGAASALKMSYAAYTKGSAALILGVRALAAHYRVGDALLDEWNISQKTLKTQSELAALGTSGKAWRFVGEMEEIAATFGDADLPTGFHEAAAALYDRMAAFKDQDPADIDAVVAAILKSKV
jgi:3-hydroxyisobutyrate dehydrogenase-like beta-hydroxyacid dehydrogenase